MQSGGDSDVSTFCKDVLFTFNVAPQGASDGSYRTNTSTKSKASTTAYAQVWKSVRKMITPYFLKFTTTAVTTTAVTTTATTTMIDTVSSLFFVYCCHPFFFF
jgi:hypothetical protein